MSARPMGGIDLELPFVTGSRFHVRGLLGRGASGVVYRVHDREAGCDVALKTLVSPDVEQIYHLKAEFRSLARIAHPNLVQLDELVVTSDACFFTMELVDGATLSDWAKVLPTELKVARLREVGLQLASGIAALHDEGKLHRDIKPSNILVSNDQRAVLVDFGLCTELRLVERRRSALVGTLLYMAPEQAWGKPLTRAADWYALGAVLYEALVGRLPFDEEGSRLLFAKEKIPDVPRGLAGPALPLVELAAALMHPSPEQRPAPDVVFATLAGGEPRPRRRGAAASFVGRLAEQETLRAALGDVEGGRPAVVHVEGASGIGKTELVERFLAKVEDRPGTLVLRGRCHPQESVSYNGFDGIVDALSEWMSRLASSEVAEILPEDADALQAIFPVFGRITSMAPEPEGAQGGAYELRRRSFRALRELFAKTAERYTVVVAIDDAQWGGADTAALVGDVFRPPYSPRVLLLLAYRSEDDGRSAMLSDLRERAGILFDSIHRVVLGPLDLRSSCELAAELVGGSDPPSRQAAEHIAAETGGHPLFLRELALSFAASPEAVRSPGERADLGALLAERIGQLPQTERELLELASVASRPLPRRTLLSAAGAGTHGRSDVVRLARKRLLRETAIAGEPAVEPFHSRVRDAVLGASPSEERRMRHRAVADALLAEVEPDADALVDLLLGAGDPGAAARFAVVAAARAHDTLAFDRAVHLYRVALDGAPGASAGAVREQGWRIRERLAAALVDAGKSREAADAFAAAAREAAKTDRGAAADLERRAAEQFMRGGHIDDGIALLRRVLASSSVPYPGTHAAAFATTLAFRARLSVRGFDFDSRSSEQVPAEELARVDACWSAGLGHAWVDTTRAAAFQARYMLLALRAGEPSRVSLGLATEASQMAAVGGRRRTERART
ncbi:MAG TPA: protein kinase, partial [Gaiellaceae bacterium]|nr:protein kinase [Gaiellaceae bacterium]